MAFLLNNLQLVFVPHHRRCCGEITRGTVRRPIVKHGR